MRKLTQALVATLALMFAMPALADGPGDAGPDRAAAPVRAAPLRAAPANAEGRSGAIPLNGGELALNVPAGYRFYSAEEAYAYMQRNRAEAPSGAVLGLLAPAGANVRQAGTWATVVSYDAIGYVQPETASGLQAESFETDVRTARASQNRTFEGFAAAPAFEATAPTVVWAERAAAPGSGGRDLRHEQKMLGRHGVACLTSIGSADQMDEIMAAAGDLQGMLSFPEGRRHADFQPANDQVSAYSVPGLVTGVSATDAQALADAAGEGQSSVGGLAGWFPWIALGVAGLAGVGYMVMRRREDDDLDDDDDDEEAPQKA